MSRLQRGYGGRINHREAIARALDRTRAMWDARRRFRPDTRTVDEALPPPNAWSACVIHFSKNAGRRLGTLSMSQMWWYAEHFRARARYSLEGDGPYYQPQDRELSCALYALLYALTQSPEEAPREAEREACAFPTAATLLWRHVAVARAALAAAEDEADSSSSLSEPPPPPPPPTS